MDVLYLNGAHFIRYLQQTWNHRPSIEVMAQIPQYVADPDTMLVTLFPFLLAIDQMLALRFLLTVGVVDSLNNVIKWILQGERPYWWVREYLNSGMDVPDLEHYPLTCETGPGSPSGHAMLSSAVGFVFLSYLCCWVQKQKHTDYKRLVQNALWFSYILLLTVVCFVRLHIATHFPHQVVLGSALGALLGWAICRSPVEKLRSPHYLAISATLLALAFGTYHGLVALGADPSRTLQLALKHCADKSFIKLTTTPWHAVFRNFGIVLACAPVVATQTWLLIGKHGGSMRSVDKISLALVSELCIQVVRNLCSLFATPYYVFYSVTVLKNGLYVLLCLVWVPRLVKHLADQHQCQGCRGISSNGFLKPDSQFDPMEEKVLHSKDGVLKNKKVTNAADRYRS